MAIIGRGGLKSVFQIERIDVERVDEMRSIFQIHRRTIEVDQHPFVRIEIERLRVFAAVQQKSIFRTEKSAAGIRRVDVHPEFLPLAHPTDAHQIIERTLKNRWRDRSTRIFVRVLTVGVVPSVATMKNGINPFARSSTIAASTSSPCITQCSSVEIFRS